MENNQEIRDNNSDSENSEWAVIDEDASLEWNDEAKYHFRSTHHKSDTKETSLTRVQPPAFSGNTSDEDSIEVVSDLTNDDHITDDVDNFDSHDEEEDEEEEEEEEEEDTVDEVKSSDIPLRGGNEMIWYRLGERNAIAEDGNNANLVKAKDKKQNALNLSDNWDLVAILIVALIGGFAVGYFCGSHRTEVAPSHLLVNKLQCAVANMRWHQNRLRRAGAGLRAPTTCGITSTLLNSTTLCLPAQPLGSIKSEHKLEGDGRPSRTQVKLDTFLGDEVGDEVEEVEEGFADDGVPNIDLPLLADLYQQVEVQEYTDEDAPEVISSDPLREGIEKVSCLMAINEKFPNFDGPTSHVKFLKRVDFSLDLLDSILKTVPLQQTNKVTNYRQDVEKVSKKLLRRIDKSVTRFAKNLNNKLDESKSVILKKLCKQWAVTGNENHFASMELVNTVFEECGRTKQGREDTSRKADMSTSDEHISKPSTHKVAHKPLVHDKIVKPTIDVKQRKKEAHKAAKPTVDVKQHKKEAQEAAKSTVDVNQRKKSGDKIRSKRDATAKIMPTKEKGCADKADCNHEPQEVMQNTASEPRHHTGKRDKKIASKETPLPDNYERVDEKKSNIVTKETVMSKTVEEHKETLLPDKSVEDKEVCGSKKSKDLTPQSMDDESVSDDFNKEYDMEHLYPPATVNLKGNERGTDHHSDGLKATNKADSVLASDNGTSNVSGEWVLRMGNSRAKQRQNDHQSDWLFDRAQSRKCHRGSKDCMPSFYTKHIPSEFKFSSGAGGDTRKERKHWLKNAIPKRMVDAAKTAKNAFKEFGRNMKQKMRF